MKRAAAVMVEQLPLLAEPHLKSAQWTEIPIPEGYKHIRGFRSLSKGQECMVRWVDGWKAGVIGERLDKFNAASGCYVKACGVSLSVVEHSSILVRKGGA